MWYSSHFARFGSLWCVFDISHDRYYCSVCRDGVPRQKYYSWGFDIQLLFIVLLLVKLGSLDTVTGLTSSSRDGSIEGKSWPLARSVRKWYVRLGTTLEQTC